MGFDKGVGSQVAQQLVHCLSDGNMKLQADDFRKCEPRPMQIF